MPTRIGVDPTRSIVGIDPAGAKGADAVLGFLDIVDHDVEVELLWTSWVEPDRRRQVGESSWKAIPEDVLSRAITTQSSDS